MSTISIFVYGREFHIATETSSERYFAADARSFADSTPVYLKSFMITHDIQNINTVIYSPGPGSFTSVRVINSIARGISVAKPRANFIGISSFLTYLFIASKKVRSGQIAIPTMRGDYFVAKYDSQKLQPYSIQTEKELSKFKGETFFDSDEIFANINLACKQLEIPGSQTAVINESHIKQKINIDYGFTPKYVH